MAAFCKDCKAFHDIDGPHTRPAKLHPTGQPSPAVAPELRESAPETRKTVVVPQQSAPQPPQTVTTMPDPKPLRMYSEAEMDVLRAQLASAEASERKLVEDIVRWTARIKKLEGRNERAAKILRGEE